MGGQTNFEVQHFFPKWVIGKLCWICAVLLGPTDQSEQKRLDKIVIEPKIVNNLIIIICIVFTIYYAYKMSFSPSSMYTIYNM